MAKPVRDVMHFVSRGRACGGSKYAESGSANAEDLDSQACRERAVWVPMQHLHGSGA